MKRIIAVMLTLCLLAGALSVGASASSTAKAYDVRFSGYLVKGDVEKVCYYTDDWFLQDAKEYNTHLATMSLYVALSANARIYEEGMSWTTQITDSSNAACQNACDLLSDLGYSQIAVNDNWNDWPTPQGIGVVVANKALADGEHLVALAVRGGSYEEEWASNFTVGAEGEHEGFASATAQTLDFLKAYLADCGIDGAVKLWVVGYSRGGAVANMTAGELNNGYDIGAALASEDLFAYTFEAPMGTTTEKAAVGNHDNIHNIINPHDAIARVAPSVWGFTRYGVDHELPSAAVLGDKAFAKRLNVMLSHYATFDSDEERPYTLAETAVPHTVKINWTKLLSGVTDNAVTIKEGAPVAPSVLWEKSLKTVADKLIGGREVYASELQSDITELTEVLMSGKPSGNIKTILPLDAIMECLSERLTSDAVMEMVSPFLEFSKPINVRKQQMKASLHALLLSVLTDAGVTDASWYADRLTNVMFHVVDRVMTDVLDRDTTSLEAMLDIIGLVADGGAIQAHYPEVTLSWMMAEDSFYNGEAPVPPVEIPADGDVNGDGTVNITDAVLVYYHVNGKTVLEETALAHADVTAPEGVNIADAVTIYYRVNGKF